MVLDALRPRDIVVLGPTASGKSRLAARLAARLGAEVISVDSRQVYRGLALCSGLDREEFHLPGGAVPLHLVETCGLEREFSLYDFARLARQTSTQLAARGVRGLWCGGTGLYLDALLRGYDLHEAPRDEALRGRLAGTDLAGLEAALRAQERPLHNKTDLEDRERALRALEVGQAGGGGARGPETARGVAVLGLRVEAETLRRRILRRLEERLDAGMVEEVESLRAAGVPDERLERLGLEPRWLLRHLRGELDRAALVEGLGREIARFARSQHSWFRRLERLGVDIHWLQAEDDAGRLEEALERVEGRVAA
jgi:tRNA dimethylallyltransferase